MSLNQPAADKARFIIAGKAEVDHAVGELELRARVRGWMDHEAAGDNWWIGTFTIDGRWIDCASMDDTWRPTAAKQTYALDVCRHLNRAAHGNGAWLCGWIGHTEFYMLWKDAEGDIQIPASCGRSWRELRNWNVEVWEKHAATMLVKWAEHHKNMEYGKGQQKELARGEALVVKTGDGT